METTTYRVTFRPDPDGHDILSSRAVLMQDHVGEAADGGEILDITTDAPGVLERDLDAAACVVGYVRIDA